MKKIYLLLVLLFTGLQSVFAQFIWTSIYFNVPNWK
jgi:hypothetical protein